MGPIWGLCVFSMGSISHIVGYNVGFIWDPSGYAHIFWMVGRKTTTNKQTSLDIAQIPWLSGKIGKTYIEHNPLTPDFWEYGTLLGPIWACPYGLAQI